MASSASPAPQSVRCAIYTRKSSEEGLEQEFNSLDAQRQAAQAYILSQKAEGWTTLANKYDDGGFTGANMERPALRRLIEDIEARRIDCVVVYKVDRLSRSLLDFARLMGLFEECEVSFVSVTQQFNTRVPVGRLTLHILLSFAQFEREIIGERTRDKKAAARRQGKWTGGYLPLGYDLDARGGKLVVNQEEAERVRSIFGLFLETRSLDRTVQELNTRGWRRKQWVTRSGKAHAAAAFTRDSLQRLLSNEVYIGAVRYHGKLYRGEQAAVLDPQVWKQARNALRRCSPEGRPGRDRNKHGALLKGLLHCAACGGAMHTVHTRRGVRRYGYYVCRKPECRNRVPARAIEDSLVRQLDRAAPRRKGVRKLVARYGLREPAGTEELIGILRGVVKTVWYEPQRGAVTLRLQDKRGQHAKSNA